MPTEFKPKNKPIVLKANVHIQEKVAFVQNLYDKAHDKIKHFDTLRQQLVNYAIIVFSGLLAFIMKSENPPMQIVGCFGIALLMAVFCCLDYRYHTSTHGFGASMAIFTQVIAFLLDDPKEDVSFLQYYTSAEITTQKCNLQFRIYTILGVSAVALGVIIALTAGSYVSLILSAVSLGTTVSFLFIRAYRRHDTERMSYWV